MFNVISMIQFHKHYTYVNTCVRSIKIQLLPQQGYQRGGGAGQLPFTKGVATTTTLSKGCSHHHHIVPGITGPQAATMGPGEVVGNIIDHHETMAATEIIEYEYDPCHTIVLATENDWNVTVCELIS